MRKLYSIIIFLTAVIAISKSLKGQPCSGTPVAGTISTPALTVCPGTPVTLTLTGYSSGPGISIQWASSPSGSGTWTYIIGGTNSTVTDFPTASTDYQAIVVCSNSGFIDVANVSIAVGCPTADSVWPGDADYNFTVDNYDPLAIALASGATGTPRTGATINWQAEASADWADTFSTGLNYKHADCNGDGIIDNSDLTAVTNNFGLTHLKGITANVYKTTAYPDLHFDMTGVSLVPGTTVSIPLKFGTASTPVNAIYGIAGTVMIQGLSPAAGSSMSFDPLWFGSGASTLEFSKATNPGTIFWAFAKTDHQNSSGSGTIGSLTLNIPANISGQFALHLQDIKMIDNSGSELTDYNIVDDTAYIDPLGVASGTVIRSVQIVPNPSSNAASLEFTTNNTQELKLHIVDVVGRELWTKQIVVSKGSQMIQLPAQELPAGMYLIKMHDPSGTFNNTIKWIRQ